MIELNLFTDKVVHSAVDLEAPRNRSNLEFALNSRLMFKKGNGIATKGRPNIDS